MKSESRLAILPLPPLSKTQRQEEYIKTLSATRFFIHQRVSLSS